MYAQNKDPKRLATIVAILIVAIVSAIPTAAGTTVSVDVPKNVPVGETFSVTINIDDVENLDSGQFDIYFNSKVIAVNVVNGVDDDCASAVKSGIVGGTEISIDGCKIISYSASFAGDSMLRVLFNLGGVDGVSGSGHLATITFEVTGKIGDCSVLNFHNGANTPQLVDTAGNKMSATWIDGNVTLGTLEPDPTATATATATDIQTSKHTTKYEITVYVYNRDDDKLAVHLLINGEDRGHQDIVSGGTSKTYKQDPFGTSDFKFEAGVHTFTIRWFDKATKKWYEKTEKHHITEATTIILQTDEHTKDEDEISAQVYVNNLDDDDQTVYLYIDGDYKKYMSIASNSTGYYDKYEFEDDEDTLHSFKMIWRDPGTDEEYGKITRSHITGEEAVTLYVDKHTKEDMILLPDETPTPVSTRSTSTATTSRSASDSQPSIRNTPSSTTFHTDPTLSENSAETNGSGQGITWYSLVGLLAAVFALLQIRRS